MTKGIRSVLWIVLASTCHLASGQQLGQVEPGITRCDSPISVEFGKPRPIIDGIGWVLGGPKKLLMWNRKVDNHAVSAHTVSSVTTYLAERQLDDVKVRVNQYDPVGEWRRLVANDRVAPGWKYTFGTLRHLGYTVFPGRLFGGDEYNPFTNTLNLYSDLPAMGLAESAYALDIHSRQNPGAYAVVQTLPIVAMWHETLATDEVMTYVSIRGSKREIDETRRVLYARYGITLGGELGRVLPDGGTAFEVLGAGTGHLLANHEAKAYR